MPLGVSPLDEHMLIWQQPQTLLQQLAYNEAIDALAAVPVAWLPALGCLYFILLALLTSSPIPFQEPLSEFQEPLFEQLDVRPVAKARIEVEIRCELIDGRVADLLEAAEDFEDVAQTSGQATCQAFPETSLAESKYALCP